MSTKFVFTYVTSSGHFTHQPKLLFLYPLGLLPFENGGMNLVQRCLNTYFSFVFEHIFRNMYILGQVNGLLNRHFPGQVRPDLLALERNVSVAFSFGHPLILDGWSPMAPNYVQLGKYF